MAAKPRLAPVYVADGARTPFLKAQGRPGPFSAVELAVAAGKPLLLRQPFAAEELDEVILGNVSPGPDEANIARVATLRLGCGKRVPAWTVHRNCGSGMQALDVARQRIAHGECELVLAGGTEAMSHSPVLWGPEMVTWLGAWAQCRSLGARLKTLAELRARFLKPVIGLLRGLTDPVVGLSMGQTAEILAAQFGISREQMDSFALESHRRAALATDEKRLKEVEPLYGLDGTCYQVDEGVRGEGDPAKMAKLKPAFDRPHGLVTAGNSAQITDGAAWLILASEKAVQKHGLTPLGRLTDCEWAGLEPERMGLGPVYAATPLMRRRRLALGKVDYWEINEAFAAQVLACLAAWRDASWCRDELGTRAAIGELDPERLNVDGGAVALGHPVGTSGARIVLHLLHTLEQKQASRGIAALCVGGGQGGAMLVER